MRPECITPINAIQNHSISTNKTPNVSFNISIHTGTLFLFCYSKPRTLFLKSLEFFVKLTKTVHKIFCSPLLLRKVSSKFCWKKNKLWAVVISFWHLATKCCHREFCSSCSHFKQLEHYRIISRKSSSVRKFCV